MSEKKNKKRKGFSLKKTMINILLPEIDGKLTELDKGITNFLQQENQKFENEYSLLITQKGIIGITIDENTFIAKQETITIDGIEKKSIKLSDWLETLIKEHV